MQKKYQAQIYVTLRPSVLDPAGVAVQSGLKNLGYDNVEQVRIGKYIEMKLTAASEEEARQQLERACDQLLANPVIENYRFDLKEMTTASKADV
ncbi:MAG: phosphoribosylformylglycinamidine synthase subunit PurS [Oscillatoriaceae bacterium SKW80]|nr:phosphoribosylformylglycinamidine synthase subunit PurS [Oscillatoriaceae bacterium SKYG93]MCX8119731.1 phosphoribosylformylglycinamidine synthase subunit PurS [Oscillatoriaceae bacterium SKW80]MDW8452392.1 phosphoribosylformylglycinamidine synthase subunit PurS [Oscillatoriaceae cyanobacterium SKYGB_i_bin93]HIK27635.1 phosphoribosylformylglycinamidine synthase subunit PurS [Oscillatoriaceae cyanobacterium M7585_C2015_266]